MERQSEGEMGDTHLPEPLPPLRVGQHGKHELAHVEGVAPVVVRHVAIVSPVADKKMMMMMIMMIMMMNMIMMMMDDCIVLAP